MNPPSSLVRIDEIAYSQYLAALLAGDHHVCRQFFTRWLDAGVDLRVLYQDLVQRSLYDVGALWERGQISVAVEHLATAITETLLTLSYPRLFARPRSGRAAVVTCLANEFHQIGGKMVADLFELNGWRSYFLGANTPLADFLGLIQSRRPDVAALSLTVYFNLDELLRAATAVRDAFPNLPILVGGQAFRWGGRDRVAQIPGVHCLTSLAELESWIHAAPTHAN